MILDDIGIGYDIYCTRMEWLRYDAECRHAQIAKLMDSQIVYIKNQSAYEELLQLREQAKALLQSDERFERADEQIKQAKLYYAEACLCDRLSAVRMNSAGVIVSLLSAVMLYNGRYFRRGTKRTFDELGQLPLSERFLADLRAIPLGRNADELRRTMRSLIGYVSDHTSLKKAPAPPSADNLSGTFEEMYSNWRNKVEEAADNGDVYSSFMNMCFLQNMIDEIAADTDVGSFDLMEEYDPNDLHGNVRIYDRFLKEYEAIYKMAGISVNRFDDVDRFCRSYTNE